MFLKLLSFLIATLMLLPGTISAMAESFEVKKEAPEEPIVTDAEFIHVSCAYDAETNRSIYTLTLKDGAPVSAQDVLFTWYVYLDPSYAGEVSLSELSIPGARSYRMQYAQDRIDSTLAELTAIRVAGSNHEWSESDGWTADAQETWQRLNAEYLAAGTEGFPLLAEEIIRYCSAHVHAALDRTADEIAANESLEVAYAMVEWGHALYQDGRLTTKHSPFYWDITAGDYPTLDDYAEELRLLYDGDLGRAWSYECPNADASMPELPDVETAFIEAMLSDAHDSVTSIAGIRMIDDVTLEIELEDVDMRSEGALFGIPMLCLSECGDETQWSPEDGLYGHPFGDVSDVDANGVILYEAPASLFSAFE